MFCLFKSFHILLNTSPTAALQAVHPFHIHHCNSFQSDLCRFLEVHRLLPQDFQVITKKHECSLTFVLQEINNTYTGFFFKELINGKEWLNSLMWMFHLMFKAFFLIVDVRHTDWRH